MAYSSAKTPKDGTTNLHVDISDAVNLLIYATAIKKEESKKMLTAIEKSGCSAEQMERYHKGEIPGALWHIFRPQDADEIRSFLVKVYRFVLMSIEEIISNDFLNEGRVSER